MDAASNVSIAGSSTSSPTAAPKAKNRLYTCPLDQVVQELDQAHVPDSKSFSRLFTDHEGSELQFSQSVFEMMNQFSQVNNHLITCCKGKTRCPVLIGSLKFGNV